MRTVASLRGGNYRDAPELAELRDELLAVSECESRPPGVLPATIESFDVRLKSTRQPECEDECHPQRQARACHSTEGFSALSR